MKLDLPFDAIRRSEEVEALVMDGNRRLYYRFRSSGHYGGVVTADSVGCNLLCAYCWNYRRNLNPVQGDLCSPAEVVSKLGREATRKGIRNFRISGAEPILGKQSARHPAEVLLAFPGRFIVETNGIMLGYNPDLLDLLLPHSPYIRLTIKGDSPERFQEITGADGAAFHYQTNAARELRRRGGAYGIAAMTGAVDSRALGRIFPDEEIEWEEFGNFGNAEQNLRERGVRLERM
ncbi:MAG: radical SAM protein [Acidobacteria bacterium]|nr:radical SAM protein [Acidobacteriota bacterium]